MTDPVLMLPLVEAFPSERRDVDLADLPPDDEIPGPPPTAGFVAEIRANGQLEPVVLARLAGCGRWFVVSGGRRIKTRRRLNAATVDAIVRHDVPRAVALVWRQKANTRSPNPLAVLDAIRALALEHGSLAQIAAALDLTQAEVKQALPLLALPAAVLGGVQAGTVALGVARAVARLPSRALRAQAAERLAEQGRLTARDVQDLRAARSTAPLQTLGLTDPAPPPPPTSPTLYFIWRPGTAPEVATDLDLADQAAAASGCRVYRGVRV